ncbi:MAG: hypothetical protein COA57_00900 [Flavobacteriales bacterium]|nr:MAG: hypothetical protein COA57_00900 [Flavobacteriales bacterium]
MLSLNIQAQRNNTKGNVVLKGKVYVLASKRLHDFELPYNTTITIDNITDKQTCDFQAKSDGSFKVKLHEGKVYMLYVEKDGYVTKGILIDTSGANNEYKYKIFTDIILKKEGLADYAPNYAVACLIHDNQHENFQQVQCHNAISP